MLNTSGEVGNHRRCTGEMDDVTVTSLGFEQSACVTCGPTYQHFVDAVKISNEDDGCRHWMQALSASLSVSQYLYSIKKFSYHFLLYCNLSVVAIKHYFLISPKFVQS